jgi:hypothetical protein
VPLIVQADSEIETNTVYFYASQSGEKTLDQGEGGGNPFASALIDLLAYDELAFEDFQEKLVALTENKSRQFQRPEIAAEIGNIEWKIFPQANAEKRIALVVVFSDYSASGISSLPGARNDSKKISKALSKAHFNVQTVVDPDSTKLDQLLKEFLEQSKEADIAAIYTTGHGVEVNERIYLLPGDYPISGGGAHLDSQAIQLSRLGDAAHAKKLNLIFYGGCRNNPF